MFWSYQNACRDLTSFKRKQNLNELGVLKNYEINNFDDTIKFSEFTIIGLTNNYEVYK